MTPELHRCWSQSIAAMVGITLIVCLQRSAQAVQPDPGLLQTPRDLEMVYQAQRYQSPLGGTLAYRMLRPATEPPQTDAGSPAGSSAAPPRQFPLVLFLHGAGERGDDNQRQLTHAAAEFARGDRRENYPAFIVFPQCPTDAQWVQTPWSQRSGKGTFPETPSDPLRLALELVEQLKQSEPVDPDRVYVTGLSMGGYGSWHAAGLYPDRFAAALAVCGGGDPQWAPRYKGVPIWCVHGDSDSVVPVERGREMVSALALAGHQPELRYTEMQSVGHNSWTATYGRDDVHEWLFHQHRNHNRPTSP